MLTYGSDVDADADLLRSSLAKERPRRAGRLLALDIVDGTVRWAVDTASPRRNA